MGEAKRRKISGDYPIMQKNEEPMIDVPAGRKVGIVGTGMGFGTLVALLASGALNLREEAQ